MKRLMAYGLFVFAAVSILFAGTVLVYSGLGKVTDTTLSERERVVVDLERQAQAQTTLAEYWREAETEYNSFRERYLIRLDRFAELRRSLGDMISRHRLVHSGLKYTNRNSKDGKVIFVRFSFAVEGGYEQIKHLIWDLERLPHVARIGKLTLRQNDSGRIVSSLELEVVFEK